MTDHRRFVVVFAAVLLVAGCGGEEPNYEETHHYEDEGDVCFAGDEHVQLADRSALEADAAVEVTVVFEDCLSSSCSEFHERSCSIERDGDTLTVTSQGSYTDISADPTVDCTGDCAILSTTCTGPELEEGTYTLEHADNSWTFDVPGTEDEPACLGE